MALQAVQSICVTCGNLVFRDVTGPYDAQGNPGGYGGPNPEFGDSAPYTAAFFPPRSHKPALVLDLLDNTPEPDADGHYTWTLTPTAFTPVPLGGVVSEARLKSGVWTVAVQLGADVRKISVLVYDDIEQRVADCICKDVAHIDKWAELQGAKFLFGKFKNDAAQKMIDRLYKDTDCCKKKDCGC